MMNEQVTSPASAAPQRPTTWFACHKNWGVSLQTLNGEQCISIEVADLETEFFSWRLAEGSDLAFMTPEDSKILAGLLMEVYEAAASKFDVE